MLVQLLLVSGLLCGPAAQDSQKSASISGTVTSQDKTAVVPGAEIQVTDRASGQLAGTALTDEKGAYQVSRLGPGTYQVSAWMEGFAKLESDPVTLSAGQQVQIDLDLQLASLQESVEVVATRPQEFPETGTSQQSVQGGRIDIAPVRGDDFRALLPLLPGIIRSTDGRLIMKGGRPTQSSLVVNSSNNATDPSTGDFGFSLPVDAVESVNVLPNPYASEYGRFSSGVTNILTRQGTNQWKFTVNNFMPRLKLRDGAIMGIGGFTPRFGARGPLVKDKLFLAQTIQYRFLVTDVPSLPELEADTRLESFASFTQLDANLSEKHTLSTIISVFPRKLDFANLDTFNPRPATVNIHQRGYNIGFSERAILSPST
ncbi:MAG: carboxypeptidase regulatory-like domain-containing protein, partial [Acidobacteriota bacterium]